MKKNLLGIGPLLLLMSVLVSCREEVTPVSGQPEVPLVKFYGTIQDDYSQDIRLHDDLGFILTSYSAGKSSFESRILKTDVNGTVEWEQKTLGQGVEIAGPSADGGTVVLSLSYLGYFEENFGCVDEFEVQAGLFYELRKINAVGEVAFDSTNYLGGVYEDNCFIFTVFADGNCRVADLYIVRNFGRPQIFFTPTGEVLLVYGCLAGIQLELWDSNTMQIKAANTLSYPDFIGYDEERHIQVGQFSNGQLGLAFFSFSGPVHFYTLDGQTLELTNAEDQAANIQRYTDMRIGGDDQPVFATTTNEALLLQKRSQDMRQIIWEREWMFGQDISIGENKNWIRMGDWEETPDGGWIITGLLQEPASEELHGILIKLDQSGEINWTEIYTFGGKLVNALNPLNVAVFPSGELALSGTILSEGGDTNIFLARTNQRGKLIPVE